MGYERQAAYRKRQAERADKMRSALLAIIAKLEGRDKPLSNELRQIARDGLGIVTGPGISCQIAPDGTRTTTLGDLVRVDKL